MNVNALKSKLLYFDTYLTAFLPQIARKFLKIIDIRIYLENTAYLASVDHQITIDQLF